MLKDIILKTTYQVTRQQGNCKNSNKIVVILTDYHPAETTLLRMEGQAQLLAKLVQICWLQKESIHPVRFLCIQASLEG